MLKLIASAAIIFALSAGASYACDSCDALKAAKADADKSAAVKAGDACCPSHIKTVDAKSGATDAKVLRSAETAKAVSFITGKLDFTPAYVVSKDGEPLIVKDALCQMAVTVNSETSYTEHNGKRYYFCSSHCQEKFMADPAKFTAEARSVRSVTPAAVTTN